MVGWVTFTFARPLLEFWGSAGRVYVVCARPKMVVGVAWWLVRTAGVGLGVFGVCGNSLRGSRVVWRAAGLTIPSREGWGGVQTWGIWAVGGTWRAVSSRGLRCG